MPARDVRAVAVLVVVGAALGAAVAPAVRPADIHLPIGFTIGLGAAVGLVAAVVRAIVAVLDVPVRYRPPEVAEPDRHSVLAPWERRLGAAARDRRVFVAAIQPVLADLARERLRLHRGLDLDRVLRDPVHGRTVLGGELWQWLTTTDRDGAPPTAGQLTAMIAAVEAL